MTSQLLAEAFINIFLEKTRVCCEYKPRKKRTLHKRLYNRQSIKLISIMCSLYCTAINVRTGTAVGFEDGIFITCDMRVKTAECFGFEYDMNSIYFTTIHCSSVENKAQKEK